MTSRRFLVLGVHRSGTSLLTEMAIRLGLHGGGPGDLGPGDRWNEQGYWEHAAVKALDEELLERAGFEWWTAAGFEPEQVPEPHRSRLASRARAIVAELDGHAPWAVKDPRLCVLLPFWLPFLESPAFLFSLRSPLSVARSLRARDGLPLPLGVALWETQLLRALESTKGRPRAAFWYEDLVGAPAREGARLASWLRGRGCDVADPATVGAVADPVLRHQAADAAEEESRLAAGARRLLGALRSGEAFADDFETAPSEDAREVVAYLDSRARAHRFLEQGWTRQREEHGRDIRSFEEMLRVKDEYVADLEKHLFEERKGRSAKPA